MYVPEIIEVKEVLEIMKSNNLIDAWELPYENLLTRRSAAIFFITPGEVGRLQMDNIWKELDKFDHFSFRKNEEKKLSNLEYRITFSEEEKVANASQKIDAKGTE